MSYGLIHDAGKLRKLIAENPELPIVVLASEEANCGEWGWQYCSNIDCTIAQILDIKTSYDREDGVLFDDRIDFHEAIADALCDIEPYKSMNNEEFDEAVEKEAAKYYGEWRKVIAIYASN